MMQARNTAAHALCRLVILAGDISPIDVITHVPVLCEDNDIPYVYVPSKEVRIWRSALSRHFMRCVRQNMPVQHLANASQTRRPTSCLMVLPKPVKAGDAPDEDVEALYKEVKGKMSKLDTA